MAKKPKPKSFWDALPKALMAKGYDPYSAKATASHVQSIMLPYAEAVLSDPDVPPPAVAAFKRIFIGA